MTATTMQPFGPLTPVVPGITLLEASAGTGKTYQITNLVLRLLVDNGIRLPRILVVTFTKAATAELKDRIRQRLVQAQRAVELGEAPLGDDLLVRFIRESSTDPDRKTTIGRRLRRAREEFDQALISTIHGFCQRMLQLHAFETGSAFGRTLETDASEVLETIVDDWLVRRLHDVPMAMARLLRNGCGLSQEPLRALARLAMRDPDMPYLPARATCTLEDWFQERAALEAILQTPGNAVEQLTELVAGRMKAFHGATYRATSAAGRQEELRRWLASPDHLPDPEKPWIRWFFAGQLAAKATSAVGHALAADPFFARLEALVRSGPALATGERIAFVQHLRTTVSEVHRSNDTQSFQDLLRDLARVLDHADRGPRLCAAIRSRFDAALIDEFQDTDALQWTIFGRVFGGTQSPAPDHYLYLIGDPKQAIYGFRGANVHVYLNAREAAPTNRRFTMRRNYRSDGRLVAAMNHLLDRTGVFGDTGIDYIPVSAHHADSRLRYPDSTTPNARAPLQLVWVDEASMGGSAGSLLGNTRLHTHLAAACAVDIVDLLHSDARIEGRPIQPGDCAVLVRGHKQAADVRTALSLRGVPAVIASQGQVFQTAEAHSLHRWLQALSSPSDHHAARVLAADPLLAWSAAELPGGTDDNPEHARYWESWLVTLGRWRSTFQRAGFMAAFRAMLDHEPPWSRPAEAVGPRVLGTEAGERRMTDLLHLAELLHTQHTTSRSGLVGLTSWLERQRQDGHADAESAELRLETDEQAVQVVTVHKSKGLQYGVVFAPFLWKDEGGRSHPPVITADPDDPTKRHLVLSTQGELADAASARSDIDSRQEGTRLLYVALTRARHRCVVYCPGMMGGRDRRVHGPLSAILHGAPPDLPRATTDRIGDAVHRLTHDALEDPLAQLAELQALAESSTVDGQPTVGVRSLEPFTDRVWSPPSRTARLLRARTLRRPVDDGWRRHSYSALTRAVVSARTDEAIDPARGLGFDDDDLRSGESTPQTLPMPPAVPETIQQVDVPLAALPAGADAGTCLHAIFEYLDFQTAHPDTVDPAELRAVARQQLSLHGFSDTAHVDLIVQHLPAVLTTPLAPLLPDHRLCDIRREDRLDELRFDFPIAGGDEHGRDGTDFARVTPAALGQALAQRGPNATVPSEWVDQVAQLGFAPLAGMMTGSIDLVFRVRATSGDVGRWFVVDYKSNRLDPHHTGRAPIEHFHFAGMQYEMAHHHYFLQYHLYALALHRLLRMRLGTRYRYADHFGGVMYLFFRGMRGDHPTDPTRPGARPGVFADRPPEHVIQALDDLFDGRGALA